MLCQILMDFYVLDSREVAHACEIAEKLKMASIFFFSINEKYVHIYSETPRVHTW